MAITKFSKGLLNKWHFFPSILYNLPQDMRFSLNLKDIHIVHLLVLRYNRQLIDTFYINGVILMPIYEYECTSCHHHCDLLQKISDIPETQCPQCSNSTLVKHISAAGFQLKGTGWYATDFKNSGAKPVAKTSSDNAAETKATPQAAETNKSSKGDASEL
jgi:putative FmdB family regulatory protein